MGGAWAAFSDPVPCLALLAFHDPGSGFFFHLRSNDNVFTTYSDSQTLISFFTFPGFFFVVDWGRLMLCMRAYHGIKLIYNTMEVWIGTGEMMNESMERTNGWCMMLWAIYVPSFASLTSFFPSSLSSFSSPLLCLSLQLYFCIPILYSCVWSGASSFFLGRLWCWGFDGGASGVVRLKSRGLGSRPGSGANVGALFGA